VQGDPTLIPPGYVGVVTNKADDPKGGRVQGIQKDVLQPGIYYLNPVEKSVDIISVGYNETSLTVELARDRGAGEAAPTAAGIGSTPGGHLGLASVASPAYVPGKGIEFPSNDGFLIHMDYTAIWGIEPAQAPDVVRQFGTLKDVEQKVILPQI